MSQEQLDAGLTLAEQFRQQIGPGTKCVSVIRGCGHLLGNIVSSWEESPHAALNWSTDFFLQELQSKLKPHPEVNPNHWAAEVLGVAASLLAYVALHVEQAGKAEGETLPTAPLPFQVAAALNPALARLKLLQEQLSDLAKGKEPGTYVIATDLLRGKLILLESEADIPADWNSTQRQEAEHALQSMRQERTSQANPPQPYIGEEPPFVSRAG